MAIRANTFTTSDATGNREDLSDVVDRITPEDTPIYSMINKGQAKAVHTEWETDELAAPADNAQLEGDEYDFDATTAPTRLGNYTQIFRKSGIVSETQEAVAEAGSVNKIKHQKLKKGIELKKDIEFSIVANNPSTNADPRKSGSLSTWIETNVDRGTGGANGGYNTGTGFTTAATNGTQRAFTKTMLDSVMQQGYESGANFRHVICSPYIKSVFVSFMSDANVAQFRYAATDGQNNAIVATADVYEGPFGKVMVQPNRVMSAGGTPADRARNVFLIDCERLEWKNLRKVEEDARVAKTGDAERFVLICEGSLCVKNERGLGICADVFGLDAAN